MMTHKKISQAISNHDLKQLQRAAKQLNSKHEMIDLALVDKSSMSCEDVLELEIEIGRIGLKNNPKNRLWFLQYKYNHKSF